MDYLIAWKMFKEQKKQEAERSRLLGDYLHIHICNQIVSEMDEIEKQLTTASTGQPDKPSAS